MPKQNNHLTSHDRFIRQLMTKPNVAKEFFTHHLPARIKEIVNLNTIKLERLRIIEIAGDNDYIYTTLSYAVQSGKITNQEKFQKIIRTGLSEKSGETYMTLADIFRREGRKQALAEGHILAERMKQEGKQEGKQETALAIAKNLLRQGMSMEQIALATGLTTSLLTVLHEEYEVKL